MKRIYFHNYLRWLNIFIVVLWCLCLIISLFVSEPWSKWLKRLGYVMMIVHYLPMIFFRNYVSWNMRGITICINSFFKAKTFNFREIRSFSLEDKQLQIHKTDGTTFDFDLSNIVDKDVERLCGILSEKVSKNEN